MLKKLIMSTLIFAASLSAMPATFATSNADPMKFKLSLEVLVDARRVAFPDVKPVNENGYVLVPLRFVSDKLGGQLSLVGKDITIVKGDRTAKLTIGAKTATANGKTIALGVAANAVNGRTMVPLRFISEALGEKVEWDAVNQYVWIGSKDVPKVEDVTTAVDIKPFEKYFTGQFGDLVTYKDTDHELTKVRVLGEQDFPVVMDGFIYYRMDMAHDSKGNEYIRFVNTEIGSIGRSLYFLQDKVPVRIRDTRPDFRRSYDGGIRVEYTPLIDMQDQYFGVKDYKSTKIKNIEYVGNFIASDAVILIKNYFKNQ